MKESDSIKTRKDKFMFIVFLISITFTTIVYSAFNTQLQIKGEAIVRRELELRITDLKVKEINNLAYETYNSKYEKETTSLYVTLPANSSITYEVTVTNKDIEVYQLENIVELSNTNPLVEIKQSINIGDYINKNSSKVFTITLSNTSSTEQQITLINQYKFTKSSWASLETQFLSEDNTGDLSVNKDGVTFDISVTNSNAFDVNYKLTSNSSKFILVDENTGTKEFQIGPNETKTHTIKVTLRDDVVYENLDEALKLIIRTTYPITENIIVQTVNLHLPEYFKTIILNGMTIYDSPKSFTKAETENGYLLRTPELDDYTYFYRGVIENNYIQFAGLLWRVVRIDSNGNIRIVLNNNVSTSSQYTNKYKSNYVENIEDAMSLIDYKNSDVKVKVEEWYSKNIATHEENKFVVNSNFCLDLSYEDPIDTQDEHTVYYFTPYLHVGRDSNSFSPDFTCPAENIYTSTVGLLSAEEILAAGGYWDKPNYNYYLFNKEVASDVSQTSWTMSGSYYSISEKQAGVIVFNQNEKSLFDWVHGGNLSQYYGYRPVISLNGNTKVRGDGTKENPYQLFN